MQTALSSFSLEQRTVLNLYHTLLQLPSILLFSVNFTVSNFTTRLLLEIGVFNKYSWHIYQLKDN